jgi:hypothetical protein
MIFSRQVVFVCHILIMWSCLLRCVHHHHHLSEIVWSVQVQSLRMMRKQLLRIRRDLLIKNQGRQLNWGLEAKAAVVVLFDYSNRKTCGFLGCTNCKICFFFFLKKPPLATLGGSYGVLSVFFFFIEKIVLFFKFWFLNNIIKNYYFNVMYVKKKC